LSKSTTCDRSGRTRIVDLAEGNFPPELRNPPYGQVSPSQGGSGSGFALIAGLYANVVRTGNFDAAKAVQATVFDVKGRPINTHDFGIFLEAITTALDPVIDRCSKQFGWTAKASRKKAQTAFGSPGKDDTAKRQQMKDDIDGQSGEAWERMAYRDS